MIAELKQKLLTSKIFQLGEWDKNGKLNDMHRMSKINVSSVLV